MGLTCKVRNAGFSGGLPWLHGRVGSVGACVQLLMPLGAFQGTLLQVCITQSDMTIDVETMRYILGILTSCRFDANPNIRTGSTCDVLPMPSLQSASAATKLLHTISILHCVEHSDAHKRG